MSGSRAKAARQYIRARFAGRQLPRFDAEEEASRAGTTPRWFRRNCHKELRKMQAREQAQAGQVQEWKLLHSVQEDPRHSTD